MTDIHTIARQLTQSPAGGIKTLVRRAEIAVTCNWFAIALYCKRHGHNYERQRPTRCVDLKVCTWCGNYLGARVMAPEGARCRWYRRPTTKETA